MCWSWKLFHTQFNCISNFKENNCIILFSEVGQTKVGREQKKSRRAFVNFNTYMLIYLELQNPMSATH